MSLLPQGLCQEELLWKLSVKREHILRDKIGSAINALFKCIKTQMEEDLTVQKTLHYRHLIMLLTLLAIKIIAIIMEIDCDLFSFKSQNRHNTTVTVDI